MTEINPDRTAAIGAGAITGAMAVDSAAPPALGGREPTPGALMPAASSG